jgi:hypothetical protein
MHFALAGIRCGCAAEIYHPCLPERVIPSHFQIEVEFTLSKCLRRSTPDDLRYRYFGIGAKEGAAMLG